MTMNRPATMTEERILRGAIRASLWIWLFVVGCALFGCAGLPASEYLYQGVHLVDTSQTLEIARHPAQYREVDSAWMLGAHPSTGRVIAWSIGEAALHACIAHELIGHSAILTNAFEALTIGNAGSDVAHNFSIGLRGNF